MLQIRNVKTGEVILEKEPAGRETDLEFDNCDFEGANLEFADLTHRSFRSANFNGCNLSGAHFHHSDLTRATFIGATMQHAVLSVCVAYKVDFTGADLTGSDFFATKLAKSDFRGADLRGVKFAAATLTWCKFDKGAMAAGWEHLPEIPDLRQQILQQIENGGKLDMSAWHKCQTTHCVAGWAITLSGVNTQVLRHNPALVGAGLFVRSDGMVPNFFGSAAEALIWLKNPLNDPNAVA